MRIVTGLLIYTSEMINVLLTYFPPPGDAWELPDPLAIAEPLW